MLKQVDDVEDPVSWGRRLVETHDHDPIYTMLYQGRHLGDLSHNQLKRWLVAYWLTYHAGFASLASEREGANFWVLLSLAAKNITPPPAMTGYPKWPRGQERRHWRGFAAVNCVTALADRYQGPEDMVDYIFDGVATLQEVRRRAAEHPQFGPWIGFKIADMGERVLGVPVEFPENVVHMYRDPRRGAEMAAERWGTTPEHAVDILLAEVRNWGAPPDYSRPCNIQEVETILCKWKSYARGHYYVGKDVHEVGYGMRGWCSTAEQLKGFLPAEVPR